MRRFVPWTLIIALSLSIGLQWALVQAAAWAGMIVSFSKETTFARAVSMTFDGAHPCRICKAVREGEPKSQSSKRAPVIAKIDLAAPEHGVMIFDRGSVPSVVEYVTALSGRMTLRPPLPPPRFG